MSDTPPVLEAPGTIEMIVEPNDGREPCPDCGLRFFPGPGMGVHRSSKHNAKPKRGRPPGSRNKPRIVTQLVTARRVGSITAEQITEAAAAVLWPDGVPHKMLPSLLRWHTQTADFLDTVQPEIPDE